MKRNIFCPRCGKTINKKQEFCAKCRPKKDLVFKDIYFEFCIKCNSFHYKNKWNKTKDEKSAAAEFVKDNIKQKVEEIKVNIPNVKLAPGVNIDFSADIKHESIMYELPGRFLVTLCPKCSKEGTQYFEGILQVRNPKNEVIDYINKMIEKDDKVYLSTIKDVKGGIDFYISSKRFLRKLGKELKKRFEGELKESPQLFSRNRQTSKDIYRLNVLFRCT